LKRAASSRVCWKEREKKEAKKNGRAKCELRAQLDSGRYCRYCRYSQKCLPASNCALDSLSPGICLGKRKGHKSIIERRYCRYSQKCLPASSRVCWKERDKTKGERKYKNEMVK